MTANDQRRAHWAVQAKAKKDVGKATHDLAKAQNITNLRPSSVGVTWFPPDKRRRDVDSLGPFLKAVLDGLVQAGAWEDDHCGWVVETRTAINMSDTQNARIEVRISEVENAG
ncbi:Crossover junction endodeoxyribonuclease rusA [Mycobacteroides abscessus subsp. abscessus]|nr:Crossover junction endodeoxyribonuclease rusA [Mycobacteroides abscessus subsp. abscessus]